MAKSAARIQFLTDRFHGAAYRSIDYWAADVEYNDGRDGTEPRMVIKDFQNEKEPVYTVTLNTIAKGVNLICKKRIINDEMTKTIMLANRENDASYMDAFDYDAVVQAGIFGDVLYG